MEPIGRGHREETPGDTRGPRGGWFPLRGRRRICTGLALLQLSLPASVGAASGDRIDLRQEMLRGRSAEEELRQHGLWPDLPPSTVEGPVDAALYRLVPGDQLHLGLWGDLPHGYPLAVSPQGELIVPKIGPVAVAGLTLEEAEDRVRQLILPYYPSDSITLRLLRPGRFRIFVAGLIQQPGVFETTRMDRLSSLLAQAGGVRSGASLRGILIIGGEGDSTIVDLIPWLVRGDLASNPTLSPGDRVEVPNRGAVVRVRGPVNGRTGLEEGGATAGAVRADVEPIWIAEWKEGDSVGSVIELMGGLSDLASGHAVLQHPDGMEQTLNLAKPADLGTPLGPGDNLELLYAPRWVFVIGAVRVPGRYPYLPGLRARDYVHMAGGPTELGRNSGWRVELETGDSSDPEEAEISPGTTIRVPERRSYKLTTVLAPITSATALIISIVALVKQGN